MNYSRRASSRKPNFDVTEFYKKLRQGKQWSPRGVLRLRQRRLKDKRMPGIGNIDSMLGTQYPAPVSFISYYCIRFCYSEGNNLFLTSINYYMKQTISSSNRFSHLACRSLQQCKTKPESVADLDRSIGMFVTEI